MADERSFNDGSPGRGHCLTAVATYHRCLADRGWQAADQLTPAFRRASLDRNGHPVDGQGAMAGDDLVYTVRFAARVEQGAGDLVTQPGDRSSPDVVVGRTADDCATVVGFVSYGDDLQ